MKRLITLVLILFSLVSSGQNWLWVKQFTQSPNPNLSNELDIYDVKLSASGNVYVTGSYISNFTLGGTSYNGYPSSASTVQDIFLAKLDSDGNVLWVQTAGSSDIDYPETLVLDGSENIYLSGRTKGTCDFGGGYSIATSGGFDGFVAKYNSAGTIQWVKKVAYGTDNDRVTAITLGTDGNLYLAGLFKSASVTIGDGTTGTNFTNADSNQDLYLASLTSDGSFRWAKQIPNTGNNSILRSIICDNYDEIYAGGGLIGTATIDGVPYTSSGSGDIILIKANSTDGSSVWVRKGGSTATGDDQLNSIAIYDDFTYVIGYIQGTGTIDSTATLPSTSFYTAGGSDIFVAKYNLDGRLLWKKTIGSTGADVGYGLNILNNILVATGYFSNTINFNLRTITSGGGSDAAYFVFDVESNAVSANSVSGTLNDQGQGVCLDNDYNIYLGGYFMSPSLTVGINTLTNSASPYKDLFIGKYHREFSVTFTDKKNVTCNGGSDGELTVTPYFGTPPYTYSWTKDSNPYAATDSSITGLSAGTYEVTVTDNNSDESTTSYTVTQPTAININETQTNVSCFGKSDGTINITVSGGISPYEYFWTTGDGFGHQIDTEDQSNITAGTYNVQVTDSKGCIKTGNYTVTEPSQISIAGVVTNISGAGNNGQVDATVTGGSGTYSSYSWKLNTTEVGTSEDILGLNVGGDYKLVVTDNAACKDSNTFTVLDERVFHAWVSDKTDINCKGDASGAATISYAENFGTVSILWNTGETSFTISSKTANTYTAVLTDDKRTPGDASDDETVNVEVILSEPSLALQGSITAYPISCYNGSNGILDLTPSGGTAPYTYSWNTSPVQTTQDLSGLTAGTYQVTITDSKSCSTQVSGTVTQPNDITFDFNAVQPTCYSTTTGSLAVNNLTGGTPGYSYLWSNTLTSTSISNIGTGTYWLKVTDSNGCTKTQSTFLDQPSDISISHVENKPTCPESKDGSIGLTVSGGTGTKTFFWTGPDIVNATNQDQINLGIGTYQVIATDANSCTKNYDVDLTAENDSPTAGLISSDADNSICVGDEVIFTASGGSTYEFFLNGSSIQGPSADNTYNTSLLNNGDEVFVIVTSSFGCSATSSSITTTVHPLPTVTANATQTVICDGDPVTLTGGGAVSYVWDNGVNDGVEFYPASTNTYTVTGTDANGCINTDQETITVNPIPEVTVTTTDPLAYCEGDAINTTFNADPSDGSFYQWIKDGSNISGAYLSNYTATEPGKYSVYIIKNNCWSISNEVEIVVNPLPTVTLSDLSPICSNASAITLDGGLPAGGTYAGNGVSGDSFDPAAAGAGTHTVTYSYTDANSCTNFATKDITVNLAPNVTMADLSPVCIDAAPITLDGGLPAGGAYTGNGVSGESFDPAAAGAGTHTVTYSYTDANSCSSSAAKDIVVNALPDVTLADLSPVCIDAAPITLDGGLPAGGTYTGNGVSGESFDPAAAGAGTHTVTYSYTDANSCSSSAAKDIVVNALPDVTLADLSPVCVDAAPIALDGGMPAGGTYAGNGVSGGSFDPATAGAGTHTITYSYTDANSCSASAAKDIVVNALPDVTLADLSPVCVDAAPIALDGGMPAGGTYAGNGVSGDSFDPATAGAGTYTITYSYTDANSCSNSAAKDIVVNALPDVTLADLSPVCVDAVPIALDGGMPAGGTYAGNGVSGDSFDPATAGTGTHTITYSYTDANSCSNYVEKNITVNDLPNTIISTTDPTVWCTGSTVSVNLTAATTDNYQWTLNDLDIEGATSQNYVATEAGNYSVKLTNGTCNAVGDPITISVIDPAVSITTAQSTTWCSNDEVSILLEANPSGGQSYQWLKDGVNIDGAITSNYTSSEAGVFTVKATFAGGCDATSEGITLTENPSPVIDIATDTIKIDDQSNYTLDAGAGFTTYLWSDNSTEQQLLVEGAVIGQGIFKYWVEVTNEYSCSASDTAIVQVGPYNSIINNPAWDAKLYPNPTSGEFWLKVSGLKSGEYTVYVINPVGTIVQASIKHVVSNIYEEPIDISKLPKGIYFIKFGKNDTWVIHKVVLQ